MRTEAADPNSTAGFFLVGHVHRTGRIVTDPQYRQTRRTAHLGAGGVHQGLQSAFHLTGQQLAVQALGHDPPLV